MSAVEDFIIDQQGEQQAILALLHDLILTYPGMRAGIRYKIPFYFRRSWICYLNPVKGNAIELAFVRGNELSNASGILDSKGRKQVYGITIINVREVPEDAIHEVMAEAILLDEEVPYGQAHPAYRRKP